MTVPAKADIKGLKKTNTSTGKKQCGLPRSGRDDESELDIDNAQIVRMNFSCDEEEGITVPWSERYIPHIRRLLSHGRGIKAFWNIRYDYPILLRHDMEVLGTPLDFMWGWHILQSSLPRGLGFVSPFYSDFGPWKHLSDQSPAEYGAIDGVQTKRVAEGIRRDLIKNQQWEVFLRHVYELDNKVLWPAEEIGLYVNPEELALLKNDMEAKQGEIYDKIQELVPEDLMLLSPPHGLKRMPKDEPDIICKEVEEDVLRCFTCGEIEVTERHKCKDKTLKASVEEVPLIVKRYFKTREVQSW